MREFKPFKIAIQKQFAMMSKHNLFSTITQEEKDLIWETYLEAFKPEDNQMFRERREYDCQYCRQFIRNAGGLVAVIDNQLVSLWDIEVVEPFQSVSNILSVFVKSKFIHTKYMHYEKDVGINFNIQKLLDIEGKETGETIRWEHFHINLPAKCVGNKNDLGGYLSTVRAKKEVFKRGLEEITLESLQIVIDLIEANSLLRGKEKLNICQEFLECKLEYDLIIDEKEKDNYCWDKSGEKGIPAKIRNDVIGTLLIDISENVIPLDIAVKKFEDKVNGGNYQRPTSLITQRMKDDAEKKVVELGLEDSLPRRYAAPEDLTINNVLHANNSAKKKMSVFDSLPTAPKEVKNLDKITEMDIKTFIETILPKAESIELMLENNHESNLVSLFAPVYADARLLFKWDNPYSWGYKGEFADSMKDRAKELGGRVDGPVRFTHTWNYDGNNQSLMDLHVFMPGSGYRGTSKSEEIHDRYPGGRRVGWNQRNDHMSGGVQDVDFVSPPGKNVPLENISFPNLNKMPEGKYYFKIHNWSFRNRTTSGFKAEIELLEELYEYEYPKEVKQKEWISVAEATLKDGQFTIKHILKETKSTKEIWGLSTNQFHKVSMIMNSPNHWDGNEVGNKHHFFMLENCLNPEPGRSIYNEYLMPELQPHRKVFEILGQKMKTEVSDNQISGLGFSSTMRNQAIVKVVGSFSRMIKINF